MKTGKKNKSKDFHFIKFSKANLGFNRQMANLINVKLILNFYPQNLFSQKSGYWLKKK